jgi:hypothetical protein
MGAGHPGHCLLLLMIIIVGSGPFLGKIEIGISVFIHSYF